MPVAPGITDARRSKGGHPFSCTNKRKEVSNYAPIFSRQWSPHKPIFTHILFAKNLLHTARNERTEKSRKKDRGNNVENSKILHRMTPFSQKKTSILGTQNRKIGTCSFWWNLISRFRTELDYVSFPFKTGRFKKKGWSHQLSILLTCCNLTNEHSISTGNQFLTLSICLVGGICSRGTHNFPFWNQW